MAGSASTRPSAPRPYRRGVAKLAVVLSLLAFGGVIASVPASAQQLQFPQRAPAPKKSQIALEREKSGQKQMLVQANEINYDYANNRVAALHAVKSQRACDAMSDVRPDHSRSGRAGDRLTLGLAQNCGS